TGSASVLKFEEAATVGAISITNSNQTLEIGATASLTIGAAESITNGTIQIDGGTLNDSAGVTVGSGGTLIGSGKVNATLSGTGRVVARGGTLELASAANVGVLQIGSFGASPSS